MPNSPSTSDSKLMAALAFIVIGPWKLRELAYTRVFSALSLPYEAICLTFCIIAARSGAHGFNFWAFILMEVLGFPLLWLAFAKPFTMLWEHYGKNITDAAGTYLGKPLKAVAATLAKAPGTAWLWSKTTSSTNIFGLVSIVLILCAGACSLYTGWLAKSWIEPHAWEFVSAYTQNGITHTIVTFVSYLLGLNVALLLGCVLVTVAVDSQEKGNGLVVSVAAAIAGAPFLAHWTAPYGNVAVVTYGAIALAALAINLWVYPVVACIASNGLFKAIFKALKPVIDDFFSSVKKEDGVPKAFRDLFQQATNIALTAFVGWHCYALLAGYDLNILLVSAATLFVGVFAFCLGGVALNHRWGNGVCDAVIAVAVGIVTFLHVDFLASHLGGYGAIVVGVIAAVLSFGLIVPLLYAGVRKVFSLPVLNLVTMLGTGLRVAHSYINEHTFDRVYRASLYIYHECYRARTPADDSFERVVMHLTNIGLALTLGGLTYLGLSTAVTSWLFVSVPLSAVVFVLAYSLLGQLVVAGKAPFSGLLAGFYAAAGAAAYLTPNHVFDLQYSLLIAGGLGILVVAYFYPLLYALVRLATGEQLSGLEKPLDNRLNSATKHVAEPLFAGWRQVVKAWDSLTAAFNALLGRKSRTPSQEV